MICGKSHKISHRVFTNDETCCKISKSERYEKAEDSVYALEEAVSNLEDAIDNIDTAVE